MIVEVIFFIAIALPVTVISAVHITREEYRGYSVEEREELARKK